MNPLKVILGLVCFSAAFALPAHAVVLYSDRTGFDAAYPGATVENWAEYSNNTVIPNASTLNNINYQTTEGNVLVTQGYYLSTAPNNSGIGNTIYGYFSGQDQVTFKFADPLSAFAIDINTFATTAGAYTATLSNGAIIDSTYDTFPEIGSTGYATGEFLGFSDPLSFTSLTITAPSDFAYTLANLKYVDSPVLVGSPAVPEPPTTALLILGLIGMAAFKGRLQFRKV